MNWRFFVAWRYFRTRKKERFISVISLISILGVAVGVAALIVVIGVMSGFGDELKARIIGTTPHIFIERDGGLARPDPAVESVLRGDKDVVGFSYFITGQVIIKSGESFTGAILNGIDEQAEKNVTDIRQYIKGEPPGLNDEGLFVGSELARELRLNIGDDVAIVSAASNRPFKFKVRGVFHTGLYTFDLNNIFINLGSAQKVFATGGLVTGAAVKISDEFKADEVKMRLKKNLGFPYLIRSWIDLHANLFSALMLEKLAMFAVVALVVIVACFNIASALIMRVMEKAKDIGILKAIGARVGDIKAIFRLEGFFIGVIGTALGVSSGYFLTWIQATYGIIKLPQDIYYISALPVRVGWREYLIIAVSAILLSLLATAYPSCQAARLEVVDAIRYE